MGVHNEKLGGWTEQSKQLSEEIEKGIKNVVINYYKEGMAIEEICYVVNNTVQELLLFERRIRR